MWDRQVTVFEDLRDFVEDGGREGYIKLPTGTGKTVLFTEFIEATGLRTLIVVPTNILVKQTGEKIDKYAPGIDYGKINKDAKEHGRQVTITTYDSLIQQLKKGTLNPADFELLILDEAHNSLSKARMEGIHQFTNAIKLGFTATPRRAENKQVSDLLEKEIHNMSIREGVESGLLSPFSVYLARTNTDLSNVKITHGDYGEDELEKAINTEARNKSAVDLYQQMFTGQSAVAYCSGVNHATRLAEMYRARGINAEVISGKSKNQNDILLRFKTGATQVLCNADILIEGFDEPKASVCLNLRPTLSPIVAEQRGGRVLRLDPNNSSKHAYIMDFVDQNDDESEWSILFSQIAEGSLILPKSVTESNGNDNTPGPQNPPATPPTIHIEGLEVVTNAEEVMKITRAHEEHASQANIIELQPTEFGISLFNLYQTFVGGHQKLKQIADKVVDEIREEHPELFVVRKINRQPVPTITDREVFIRKMNEKGIKLKDPFLQKLQVEEFGISDFNLYQTFVGSHQKLKQIADKVVDEIREEHPELFVVRKINRQPVPTITDREVFIRKMLEHGTRLKNPDIIPIQITEFGVSDRNLIQIFIGDADKLSSIADKVTQEIQREHPEFVVERKSKGRHIIPTITDRELFIQKMQERGVKLKSPT